MKKVLTLKERAQIRNETKQRAIYLDDNTSTDSDCNDPSLVIASNKLAPQTEDIRFAKELPVDLKNVKAPTKTDPSIYLIVNDSALKEQKENNATSTSSGNSERQNSPNQNGNPIILPDIH